MNFKVLIVAALASLAAAEAPALADVRIQVGGSLHVDGHIRIGHRRARRVYRPYVHPAPVVVYSAPRPCGCECETTCVPPPAETVVVHRAERRAWLGVGAYFSGTALGEADEQQGEGAGLVGRLKFRSVEIELSMSGTEFPLLERREGKVGGALIVPLLRGGFQPYLVVGAGAIATEDTRMLGTVEKEWGYVEGGAGLAWNLGRLTVSGDVRWSSRREIEDDDYHTEALVVDEPDREKAVEGRITGILYF